MTRDEWLGWIQDFLEARMGDAPDETCRIFAEKLWQETAEPLDDEIEHPEGRLDWGMNRDC